MNDMKKFIWSDFEAETELSGDGSGNPDTHYLTILEWDGSGYEEFAVICHRTVGGKYPLEGRVAEEKRINAEALVNTLNENSNQFYLARKS